MVGCGRRTYLRVFLFQSFATQWYSAKKLDIVTLQHKFHRQLEIDVCTMHGMPTKDKKAQRG